MKGSRNDPNQAAAVDATVARSLFWENARDILLVIRGNGRILDANRKAVEAYGYGRNELLSLRIHDLRDPATVPLVDGQMAEADRGGILFETVHRRKDGSRFPVEVSSLGGVIGTERVLLSVIRDITLRKEAEQRIADALEFNRKILDASPLCIMTYDASGQCISASGPTRHIIGAAPEQILAQNFREIGPFRRTGLADLAETALKSGTERWMEMQTTSTFGKEVWLDCRLVPFSSRGEPHLLLLCTDLKDHRQAEESLRRTTETLTSLIHASPLAIVAFDPEGIIQSWNPAAERMFGWTAEEAVGRFHPIVPDDFREEFRVLRETAVEGKSFTDLELRRRRKDGSPIDLRVSTSPIRGAEGDITGIMSIIADVTEKKRVEAELRRMEEQLRQAQKMEAVGRLAGGIAHDFNNLLTAVVGYSDLILSRLPENDPVRREVESIRKAGERASSLTRQLLAFSRRQVLQPRRLDLNGVVSAMEEMLRRLIGEDVLLVTVLPENLWAVRADPGQIEQVIVNLALNSRDAMPEGGTLIIETANVELGESCVHRHETVKPGSYVMLAVSDTGTGMDESTMSHIFEPFFTTKEVGKGTGLGLATVYGIVKQSGGYVWPCSEPEHGTTFKVYLPREGSPAEEPEAEHRPSPAADGAETVLVAEDEDMVRTLVGEILRQQGYEVLEAYRGSEALEMSERHEGPIHLLITDVVMPGMSGPDLARRFTSLRPEARVLFMSGYTDDAIVHHGVLDPGTEYIQKPFTAAGLCARVRRLLDAHGDGR